MGGSVVAQKTASSLYVKSALARLVIVRSHSQCVLLGFTASATICSHRDGSGALDRGVLVALLMELARDDGRRL